MSFYLTALLSATMSMSVVILLVLLLYKALSNKVCASHRYYLWLVVLIGLLIPFRPSILVPFGPTETALQDSAETADVLISQNQYEEPLNESYQKPLFESSEKSTISYSFILFAIWAIGALGVLAFHLRSYAVFTSSVRRWGMDVKDKQVHTVFRHVMNDMGFKDSAIPLKTCTFISSPLIIGFRNPTILLPDREITPDELLFIFRHELTHYKRRDLWMNLLILLVSAMHWFNPFVYLMVKEIRSDCEAACDEAVIAGCDADKRKHYGETIIDFIAAKTTRTPVLSTYFFGGSKNMKKRLSAIMDTSKKGKGFAAFCAIFILTATFLTGTVFATNAKNNTNRYIGEAKAKAIALDHAGLSESQVAFIKARLDFDDGNMVYDIEFYSGNTEYDYEIDALNGNILEYDRDIEYYSIPTNTQASGNQYIGEAKAIDIALSDAGISESLTRKMKVELEREHRTMLYEVEFIYGRIEYEYEIDAISGAILNIDIDIDD